MGIFDPNERDNCFQHPFQQQINWPGDVVEATRLIDCALLNVPFFPKPGVQAMKYNREIASLNEEKDRALEEKERKSRKPHFDVLYDPFQGRALPPPCLN